MALLPDLSNERVMGFVKVPSLTSNQVNDLMAVDQVTVGAAVLRREKDGFRILLLRRNADEEFFPNVFEMPGGKVEDDDMSVSGAFTREVREETSLKACIHVCPHAVLSPKRYFTDKIVDNQRQRQKVIQFTYVANVQDGCFDFKVNTAEHSMGIWADRSTLNHTEMTPEMRALVMEALEWGRVFGEGSDIGLSG